MNESNFKTIKSQTDGIHGWLTDLEARLLFESAQKCQGKGVIVELGSWKGKSTIWLANGSLAGNHVQIFAVDPHRGSAEYDSGKNIDTLGEFKANIASAGLQDLVTPVVLTSAEAAKDFNRPVELLFIDASHLYDDVRNDFESWFPKVVDGGTIIFHDSVSSPGVVRLVKEAVYTSDNFYNVGFVHSATHAQKTAQNTLTDRVKNHYALALKNIYTFTARFPIPARIKRFLGGAARFFVK